MVIVIIGIFTAILIADFPEILRQFGLSRAAYNLAQNLRVAEDLGLSGATVTDINGTSINTTKGYGIYINKGCAVNSGISADQQYVVYADSSSETPQYANYGCIYSSIINIVDLSKENPDVYIQSFPGSNGSNTESIDFIPPDPEVVFSPQTDSTEVGITLSLRSEPGTTRTVYINKAGRIRVQ